MTDVASGKCGTCGDQLITVTAVPPRQGRHTVCPTCIVAEWEDMNHALNDTADGMNLWNQWKMQQEARKAQ